MSITVLCCLSAITGAEGQPSPVSPGTPRRSIKEWAVYRGNPAHTSYSEEPLRPPLRLLWRRRLGKSPRGSSYVLAGAQGVYVATTEKGDDNAAGFRLYAIAPESGQILWQRPGVRSTGCLVGDLLVTVVNTNESVPPGSIAVTLTGIDARIGTTRWQYAHPFSVAMRNDALYSGAYINAYDGQVFSQFGVFDAATGEFEKPWTNEWPSGGPAIDEQYVTTYHTGESELVGQAFYASYSTSLLDRHSLTKVLTAGGANCFHVLVNGYMLCAEEWGYGPGELSAKPIAQFRSPSASGNPVANAPQPYIVSVTKPSPLQGAAQPGAWTAATSHEIGPLAVFPDSKGTYLVASYVPYEEGNATDTKRRAALIRAHDLKTGRVVWDVAPLTVSASGAAVPGILYLPGGFDWNKPQQRGGLYALDADTGKAVWRYERPKLWFGEPAVAGGKLFVYGSDGYLYAFGKLGSDTHRKQTTQSQRSR